MSRADNPLKDRMIFCFGARRSGTYLLQRIVAAHPEVSAVPSETHLFSHGIRPLLERFHHGDRDSPEVGSMHADRELLIDALRDFCDRVLAPYLEPGRSRIAERTPLHALHAELIAEIYPDARFCHIVRDGRDVARSLLSQEWGPDSMAAAATEWRDTVTAGRALAGRERYLELRYEELLAEPRAVVERLYGGLGLEASQEAVEAGLAALAEWRNVGPGEAEVGAGKWRGALSAADLAQFERIAGPLLRELGYAEGGNGEGTPGRALTPQELRERIAELDWYHTLELAPGVETPGYYDLRPIAPRLPFPPLEGKRCLDVGTFDGFWAFEMERRGAREVVAIDVLDPRRWDWPAGSSAAALAAIGRRKARGQGFELAREALGSSVRRVELSVYDLDPAELGMFDFVFVGSLLLHLRDPVGALARVRSVCQRIVIVCDKIDLARTRLHRHQPLASLDAVGRPWWWEPNLAALVRMMEAAGFKSVGYRRRVLLPPGRGHPPRRLLSPGWLRRAGRAELLRAWRGDPHGVLYADSGHPLTPEEARRAENALIDAILDTGPGSPE